MGGLTLSPDLLVEWATDREKFPYGERRPPYLIILLAVLFAITIIVVSGRLWARIKTRRAGLDDVLIVAALPFLIAYNVCQILGFYYYGIDRHAWEITTTQAVNARIITWAISICYLMVTTLVKISILRFYRRLGEGAMKTTWLWIIRGSTAFVALYAFVFILLGLVDCQPMEAFWKKMDPAWALTHEYKCLDEGVSLITGAVISVILDAAVCFFPLLVVRRLQMPRKTKLALTAIFGVGFFLCVCGIMRLVYTYLAYYTSYDATWDSFPIWCWTSVEVHFAIICASAPALKMFFRRAFQPTTLSNTYLSHQRQGYGHFGSSTGRKGTDRSLDEADISMEEMLAGGDAEATVGTGQVAKSFPAVAEEKLPAVITVTRGVDVTFSRAGSSQDDAGKSIGPKTSNESLLHHPS